MTTQAETSVVTEAPIAPTAPARPDVVYTERTADARPVGGGQLVRRVIILAFGLIQIVIVLRILLLLLDARAGNAIVSAVLNVSQIFVAPFNGILNTDALVSGGSVFDVAAVVALIGWTILEMVILWAVGIFRRQPA